MPIQRCTTEAREEGVTAEEEEASHIPCVLRGSAKEEEEERRRRGHSPSRQGRRYRTIGHISVRNFRFHSPDLQYHVGHSNEARNRFSSRARDENSEREKLALRAIDRLTSASRLPSSSPLARSDFTRGRERPQRARARAHTCARMVM